MSSKKYNLKDGDDISATDLKEPSPAVQLDAMEMWFYENFENPGHHCP